MFDDDKQLTDAAHRIQNLKDKDGMSLAACYQYEWLVRRLDEEKMGKFISAFRKHDPVADGVSCDKFIAVVQRVFEPRQNEAYLVTIAAIDFFNEQVLYNGRDKQNCKQFTSFLHDVSFLFCIHKSPRNI